MDNKKILSANLRKYMELNGKSREDISKALGYSYFTVTSWVNGTKYPRMDKITALANYFGVKISDLIEENEPYSHELTDDEIAAKFHVVPYDMSRLKPVPVVAGIRAGFGGIAYVFDEDDITYEYADVKNPDDYVFFKVSGDSMEPRISAGDYALIHKQEYANEGDIIAAVYNGEEGALKQYFTKNGIVVLHSFNSTYLDIVISGAALEQFRIIGKLIEIKRKF